MEASAYQLQTVSLRRPTVPRRLYVLRRNSLQRKWSFSLGFRRIFWFLLTGVQPAQGPKGIAQVLLNERGAPHDLTPGGVGQLLQPDQQASVVGHLALEPMIEPAQELHTMEGLSPGFARLGSASRVQHSLGQRRNVKLPPTLHQAEVPERGHLGKESAAPLSHPKLPSQSLYVDRSLELRLDPTGYLNGIAKPDIGVRVRT